MTDQTVGVMDIGSNTVRLVVYRVEDGGIRTLLSTKRAAGLAGYIGADGRLDGEGIARAAAVAAEFRQIADGIGLGDLFAIGTASLRNIVNTDQAVRAIREASGVEVQVISGEQEALFDYRGAVRAAGLTDGVMADIGGGSTEVVAFADGQVRTAVSVPIGSLNLYTRFVRHILPTPREVARIRREVRDRLTESRVDEVLEHAAEGGTLCLIGGTARALGRLAEQDGVLTDGVYSPAWPDTVVTRFDEHPRRMTDRLLKVAPDRLHTLLPGTLILTELIPPARPAAVFTSPYGVREGFLDHLLEQRKERERRERSAVVPL